MLLNEQISAIKQKHEELKESFKNLALKLSDENLDALLSAKLKSASKANLEDLISANQSLLNENLKSVEERFKELIEENLNETKKELKINIEKEFKELLSELKGKNLKALEDKINELEARIKEPQAKIMSELEASVNKFEDKINELEIKTNIEKSDLIEAYFSKYKSDFESSFCVAFLKNDLLRSNIFKEQCKEVINKKLDDYLENNEGLQVAINKQVKKIKLDFDQKQDFLRFEASVNFLATSLYKELEILTRGINLIHKMESIKDKNHYHFNKYAIE